MTTLEAQHEVITNLILENQKLKQERDEAREEWGKASMDAAQLLSEKTKVIAERDEAREERDKIKQLLAADSENVDAYLGVCTERDDLLIELEEYRSIAENIGAKKAVSEKEKTIRERDEAREALMKIEEIFIDGEDTYEDWKKMGNIAREALEK